MQKREKHAQSCDPSISEKHPCPAWKDSFFRTCTGVIVITLCLTMVLPLSYRISWRCLSLVSICWAPWFAWIPCVGLWLQKILLNFFANFCRLLVFVTRHFHHFIIPSVVWPWKLALQHVEINLNLLLLKMVEKLKICLCQSQFFFPPEQLAIACQWVCVVPWLLLAPFLDFLALIRYVENRSRLKSCS